MKEKKYKKEDAVTLFWRNFAERESIEVDELCLAFSDDWDSPAVRARALSSYVEDKVIECRNELASSWDDFKKGFLSDMEQVTNIVELEEEDAVKACHAGYRRGKEEVVRREKEELSLTEFKEQYLPKVEYLAEILGLDRDRITNETREFLKDKGRIFRKFDDDQMFVESVIGRILDCERKWVEEPLLWKLRGTDGAEAIFDEVYRIWMSRFSRGCRDEVFFEKLYQGRGMRSEPGKGDIVDIFLMGARDGSGLDLLSPGVGEDFAHCAWPVVVKVKHKACISDGELIKGLRDLADTLEAGFANCLFLASDGYVLPKHKEYEAILCGLHKSDPKFHRLVRNNPNYAVHESIKDAGWIDPNISLENGVGVMLEKGWPELYGRVLDRELSPFQALLETGHIHPKDMYEVCGNGWDIEELLKSKWPEIYESVVAEKISHFEALMKTDLINWDHVDEFFDNSDDRGDIEQVFKNGEPELYEKVLLREISAFRALLEANLIDAVALYRTLILKEKIEDV